MIIPPHFVNLSGFDSKRNLGSGGLAVHCTCVYDNDPLGMHVSWSTVVSATEKLFVWMTAMTNMATYKIQLSV
jgi:hypothetical protein